MTVRPDRSPLRDMAESAFTETMKSIESAAPGLVAAVFFDSGGETIDYHSYLDPYDTRLAAAHHGVIAECARIQTNWLGTGEIEALEIAAQRWYSLTVAIAEGYYLTVIVEPEGLDADLVAAVDRAAEDIRRESGL